MTRNEFADLVDRYGARRADWPRAERMASESLLAADPEARAILAAAKSVDDTLRAMLAAPLPVRLGRRAPLPSYRRMAGFGMAALAASLAIGFALGAVLPSTDDDDASASVFMALNDTDTGGPL